MLRILHTNDFHGSLTEAKADRIRSLKGDNALYFDTGDCIKAGNLAIPLKPEVAWPLLQRAGCDASVPGNRESHVLRSAVDAKFAGHEHPILCSNWIDKRGELVFERCRLFDLNGVKVGVFGVMVPIVTRKMATAPASQFLWENPITTAQHLAEELRAQVDLIIALTHIGVSRDRELAESGAPINIILGGHSHTVLEAPEQIGSTWIAQGGSHGRFVGNYHWDGKSLNGHLEPL